VFSRPGHSELCDGWLGASDIESGQAPDGLPSAKDEVWSSIQVEGLLAMLPWIDPVATRESFRRSLITYLDQVTTGNVLALAQLIRCPHSILQNWLDGTTMPRLENLLRTCRFLNVSASSLFVPSGPTSAHIVTAKESFALSGNRGVSPHRNPSELRQALAAALMAPIREACRRLREVWVTRTRSDSTKPIENSVTGSPPDIGFLAKAIGGGSQEQSGFATRPV
jgi:hypothetical protein